MEEKVGNAIIVEEKRAKEKGKQSKEDENGTEIAEEKEETDSRDEKKESESENRMETNADGECLEHEKTVQVEVNVKKLMTGNVDVDE